jgi:hypothetical protein
VPLTVCSDVSPADWIVASELAWQQLVGFGPEGFAAHARVRFLPDPVREDQPESDADADASPDEVDQWRAVLQLLGSVTAVSDDCYFGLWEGWGFPETARRWPTFGVPGNDQPPARSYFLFHGSLADAAVWGGGVPAGAGIWGSTEFSRGGAPAFVWPSDHTWCVAADIDPHWLGIGASPPVIARLIDDPRLDAIEAAPADQQPAYR